MHCCKMAVAFQSEATNLPGALARSASGRQLNISKCSSCTAAKMTAVFQSEAMDLPGDVAVSASGRRLNISKCSLLCCCTMTAAFQSEAMDLPRDVAAAHQEDSSTSANTRYCTAAKWRLSSRAKQSARRCSGSHIEEVKCS